MKLESLSCNGCGAPLTNSLVCVYCKCNHRLSGIDETTERTSSYDEPMIITIENSGIVTRNAVLFGYKKVFGEQNFGNHSDLVIRSVATNNIPDYSRLLLSAATKPKKITKWRFISNNPSQLLQKLNLHQINALGTPTRDEWSLASFYDVCSYSNTIVECRRKAPIDINTFMEIPILPGASLEIMMFPEIEASRKLLGYAPQVLRTLAPRVSAKNVPIIVINTNTGVRPPA